MEFSFLQVSSLRLRGWPHSKPKLLCVCVYVHVNVAISLQDTFQCQICGLEKPYSFSCILSLLGPVLEESLQTQMVVRGMLRRKANKCIADELQVRMSS